MSVPALSTAPYCCNCQWRIQIFEMGEAKREGVKKMSEILLSSNACLKCPILGFENPGSMVAHWSVSQKLTPLTVTISSVQFS